MFKRHTSLSSMLHISKPTKHTFFQLLNRNLLIADFEHWVYNSSQTLEKELGTTIYLDLISFNYHEKDSSYQLERMITNLIDKNEFNVWRVKELLVSIIEDKIDVVLAVRTLRQRYFDTGESFIPITLGIGYESVLDDVPIPSEYNEWDAEALEEKLKKANAYKDDIIRDAKLFLKTLNEID